MLVDMEPFKIIEAELSHIPDLCKLLALLFSQEEEFCPDRSKQEAGLCMIIENPDAGFVLASLKHESILGMVNNLLTDGTNTVAHHFYQKNGFSYSNMQIFRKLL